MLRTLTTSGPTKVWWHPHIMAPIHYQTQSHNPISFYGNSVKRTSEILYRIYEFLPTRTSAGLVIESEFESQQERRENVLLQG